MLALATDFHARCLADPALEHPFSRHLDPAHVQHLADYWGEVFGGPPVFTSRHGGHEAMLRVHANQADDPGPDADPAAGDPFSDAFVACFDAAVAATLPDDPALRAVLGNYIRAATAEVASYFPLSARVPDDPPMPLWSWDGRQGRPGSVGAAPDATRTP